MDIRFLMAQNIFFSRIFQNCLELIPAKKYIKYFSGTTGINSWKSSAMQEEKLKI